ncbi:MAG: response regulator [Deltaproteobacteria bacterium]|nr:response regulator [Deltaproteobacteria bacterium]
MTGETENGRSPLVAVVNDDATQRNMLIGLMRQNGFETLAFEGPEAAFAGMSHKSPPDIIITDLYMPGIDGWRFCRLLRSPEYKAFNRVPILVVSATFSGEEAAQVTADTGADAFAIMPPDVPHLLATVHKLLRGETEGYRPRVLIVEDSKALAQILQHTYNTHGYQARTAASLREALETFRQADFDLALIDYYLSDGHGDTLLTTFSSIRPDCVCIMMTADPDPGLSLGWMKKGASDYLRKPFDPDYLMEVCARARRETALLRVEHILERRTLELRKSEALLASTQRLSKIGGWEFDARSQTMSLTEEALRIHGLEHKDFTYGSSDHLDKTLAGYEPEDRLTLMEAFTRCLESGAPYDMEFPFTNAIGQKLWVRTAASAIMADGIVTSVSGNIMDITERRQAAEERARLEEKINQAQRMESIGRLAGGMAHDLNNLLMPILGYGEILQGEFDLDDERRQFTDEIVKAALRARDLVRQLLAYSRKQILEFRPIDLNRLITNFEFIIKRRLPATINLNFALAPKLPHIAGDGIQLEQVIMNLLENARDAMPEGGQITITTGQTQVDKEKAAFHGIQPGSYVILTIEDSGTGMDALTCAQIFEPFFTTKEQGARSGLGLATAYGIVRQHGGSIWVNSETSRGSVFTCLFPVTEEKNGEEYPAPRPQAKYDETILLVEDNPQVRNLTRAILLRKGYTVLAAHNAEHALSMMENHEGEIHLLLTDMMMPGMNGIELYGELKKKAPGIRVLLMSGYAAGVFDPDNQPEIRLDFLQKPFPLESLEKKVRELLDRQDA